MAKSKYKLPIQLERWYIMLNGKKDVLFYINFDTYNELKSVKCTFVNQFNKKVNIDVPMSYYALVIRLFNTWWVKDIWRGTKLISKVYQADTTKVNIKYLNK